MKKILVVDDEKKIVEIIKAYLEREGYQTIAAFDGKTALELALKQHPDLIVLDHAAGNIRMGRLPGDTERIGDAHYYADSPG